MIDARFDSVNACDLSDIQRNSGAKAQGAKKTIECFSLRFAPLRETAFNFLSVARMPQVPVKSVVMSQQRPVRDYWNLEVL
jgi:hypothetical protein